MFYVVLSCFFVLCIVFLHFAFCLPHCLFTMFYSSVIVLLSGYGHLLICELCFALYHLTGLHSDCCTPITWLDCLTATLCVIWFDCLIGILSITWLDCLTVTLCVILTWLSYWYSQYHLTWLSYCYTLYNLTWLIATLCIYWLFDCYTLSFDLIDLLHFLSYVAPWYTKGFGHRTLTTSHIQQ